MKYVNATLIILGMTFLGELLHALLPLPIPAAIYGILLFLAALMAGIVKTEQVKTVSAFLIGIMPILYVAPTVKLAQYWSILKGNLLSIAIVIFVSTVVVFGISGIVTQLLISRKGDKDDDPQ